MRGVIIYIGYLFFLLIGGGQYLHAETSPKIIIAESPSFDLVKKHQIKVRKAESGNVLIEEADTDLEDELHNSDNSNNDNLNKLLISTLNASPNWYLKFSSQLLYKDYYPKNNFFVPFYGHFNPIYLQIGVLRI